MPTRKPKPTPDAGILIVRESFVVEVDGVPVAYRKGEPVEPGDPVLRKMGEAHFEPLTFPHPVKRARMTPPEVRA